MPDTSIFGRSRECGKLGKKYSSNQRQILLLTEKIEALERENILIFDRFHQENVKVALTKDDYTFDTEEWTYHPGEKYQCTYHAVRRSRFNFTCPSCGRINYCCDLVGWSRCGYCREAFLVILNVTKKTLQSEKEAEEKKIVANRRK